MGQVILIVEDMQNFREMYKTLLERKGLFFDIVQETPDGEEAIDLLSTLPKPLIVLLDLGLGGSQLEGEDVLEYIKGERSRGEMEGVKVVVLTAKGQTRRDNAAQLGADYVFSKEEISSSLSVIENLLNEGKKQ
jgi:CheY-like chemotaxis protein